MKNLTKIREIYSAAYERIKNVHIACFKDMEDPLFLISNEYPGLWMEHTYDSVLLASLDPASIWRKTPSICLSTGRQRRDSFPLQSWTAASILPAKQLSATGRSRNAYRSSPWLWKYTG